MRGRLAGTLGIVAAIALAGAGQAHAGGSFTVNDPGDGADLALNGSCDASGAAGTQCTLRAAIAESNSTPGPEDILFDIPAPGEEIVTISPVTPLPAISAPVDIDGRTQPGADDNTKPFGKPLNTQIRVVLDGSNLPAFPVAPALEFGASSGGSSVRGLAIGSFPGSGVLSSSPIQVAGNFLGTDATGTVAQPNTEGFFGFGGDGSTIGGGRNEDRNLISGNSFGGVVTNFGVTVEGNYIGTEKDGKSPLGNGVPQNRAGVQLSSTSASSVVKGNVIAHSGTGGIELNNSGPGSLFTKNVMFGNNTIGIDFFGDGVTPNDPPPDADTGPNGLQNFPLIAAAERKQDKTHVLLRLESEPDTTYKIEVFEGDGNTRQGKKFVGKTKLRTDEDGKGSKLLKVKKPGKGARVVATATNPDLGNNGATSEFSKPRKVK